MSETHATIAATTHGPVQGLREGDLTIFRGIPYAAAPVGSLRWQPPQPPAPWEEVRLATEFGPTAPQPYMPGGDPIIGGHGSPPFDEDCLSLNIWTPSVDDAKRPVLVWIHGGGFVTGSANIPNYDGSAYALDGDLVVVGINYRLGPLGFLHGVGASNVWLEDQAAALRWIADNIAAFGGDPANITLAGQSGGGFSIGALCDHPQARDLFHRAIVQSPPLGLELDTPERALERTELAARILGHDSIEGLRDESSERLLQATFGVMEHYAEFGEWTLAFLPVIDESMPRHPVEALADSDIDLVIGWTRDEAALRFALDPSVADVTTDQIVEWAGHRHGDRAATIVESYREAHPGARPVHVLTDLLSDDLFRMGCVRVAEARAVTKPAWAFQFDLPSRSHGGVLGAPHCFDLPFTFGNFDRWSHSPFVQDLDIAVRDRVSSIIHGALIAFVRMGVPEHDGLPEWPAYTRPDRVTLVLDEESAPVADHVGPWRTAQQIP